MSRLMRTAEITKRPVVTLGGEDVGQIKDVVYGGDGAVAGFTLAGRGLFAGPLGRALPWDSVLALGADAVMIADEDALEPEADLLDRSASGHGRGGGDVLGSRVLTDDGTDLGAVEDVVLQIHRGVGGGRCEVVGYDIKSSEALGHKGTRLLIPLGDTVAASSEHLIVPAGATEFVTDDLAGFGAAVDAFRARLGGRS